MLDRGRLLLKVDIDDLFAAAVAGFKHATLALPGANTMEVSNANALGKQDVHTKQVPQYDACLLQSSVMRAYLDHDPVDRPDK